ncbi:MAG: insulinase family protein [Candidatus Rokubacteria bacterium]|nr:insulinase family protein [Candidatus Rokubacteria bacterium]
MRRLLALALAVALAAAVVPAGAQAPGGVRRERLPNGVTLLVRENPGAPVVAVSLLVRMGTRWETAENAGITNFVHAAMVKGTARRSGGDLADAIGALGGKISASGEVDYSQVQATALARFWRELLGLVAELALEPRLAPAEVDREREELLARVQLRDDNPSAHAFDVFYATVFGPHPYGLPLLGTRESLGRIDAAAIAAWYRRAYEPERLVLAVSGQVRADEVLAEAQRLFGSRPAGPGATEPAPPRAAATGRRVVVRQPAQQAQILIGALAPPLDHGDHAAVKVLSTVLGGGMAGRLFSELRDRQALAYTAAAYYDPVREPGVLVLYLGTAPDNAARAEQALVQEVERIRTTAVSPDELARAKGYLLGNYAMDRRTNARQAWYLAFYEVEGAGEGFPERYRAGIERVSADDVLRVARTYLGTPITVVLLPR